MRRCSGKAHANIQTSMSATNNDSVKFYTWLTLAVLLGGGLIASAWPHLRRAGVAEATMLVKAGDTTSGTEASLDYRLANALDHSNQTAALHYSIDLLARGDALRATKVINRSGGVETNPSLIAIALRCALERGDDRTVSILLPRLVRLAQNQDQLITALTAASVIGEGSVTRDITPRLSSPEALRSLLQAQASKETLSDLLSSRGLLKTSQRILQALPESAPRDIRLAKLYAKSNLRPDLVLSAKSYESYLGTEPADATAHFEAANVFVRLGDVPAAEAQRSLGHKIIAGQP
jgi:hypothetical protein